MDVVRTTRLLLRGWRPEDAEPFARLNGDAEVMRHIGDGSPLDRAAGDAFLARIDEHWARYGHGLWAVEEGGALVGFCGLAVPTFLPDVLPTVEVGWRLFPAAWGRGLATEAARASLDWGFATHGFREIVSIIAPENVRSLRVAEKLRMQPRPDRRHPATGARVRVMAAVPGAIH